MELTAYLPTRGDVEDTAMSLVYDFTRWKESKKLKRVSKCTEKLERDDFDVDVDVDVDVKISTLLS